MTENRILQLLKKYNLKVVTAESCTGGMVAGLLTDIPGISSYFEEGYVVYSESAKMKNLDVSPRTIEKFGVVSVETAAEMAQGAASRAGAQCAVSTTGIAGPDGGTEDTPTGTVCFGCVVNGQTFTERLHIQGDRMQVRIQAAIYALTFLCEKIILCYEINS